MKLHQLNLRHLRVFAKTYELGSLLAASRAEHITQPAVTQGIARLERFLGGQLFARQPDGMHPTQKADVLYPRVVNALKLIRSKRVTHTQIRAFLALARHGSYVEAGTATGLARPSLHRAVTDLEKALNQTLVQRRGRGLELTSAGQTVSRRLNLAQGELRSGLDEVAALTNAGAGRIAVGAMPLCRARVLPAAIVKFKSDYPDAEILIAEGSHTELVDPLRYGELDFMIGALRDPAPGPDLIQTPLFDDRPVVIARKGHPLPQRIKRLDLQEMQTYQWCIPPRGVPLRESWEAVFRDADIEAPDVSVECGSGIAIRQILIETDMLTLMSRDQVALELEAGWLKIVGDTPDSLVRTIGITARDGWHPTRLQSTFIVTLKACSI